MLPPRRNLIMAQRLVQASHVLVAVEDEGYEGNFGNCSKCHKFGKVNPAHYCPECAKDMPKEAPESKDALHPEWEHDVEKLRLRSGG